MSVALGLFLALEVAIRSIAAIGWVTLVPGDVHGFDRFVRGEDVPLEERLYQPDRNLIFRMRPDFRTVYPRASLFPGRPTTYGVETNDRGFRTDSFSEKKPSGIFRIVCLGDSTTFGMNVEAPQTYPEVLAELLEARVPGRFQVLNLGVPGYTSRQGIELIKREVVAFEPDLVTFGFGSNGRSWPGVTTDDAAIRFNQSLFGGLAISGKQGLDRLYTYRLVRRMVTWALYKIVDRGGSSGELPRRVTLDGIRDAIIAAHAELGQVGATLVVLNNDIAKTDARQGLRKGVVETGAAYLDMRDLFDQKRRERTRRTEAELRLPPAKARGHESLLRVRAPDSRGVTLEWRSFVDQTPSFVPMWDDGSHGDQMADDGIWSLYIPQRSASWLLYAYWRTEGVEKTREFAPGSPLGGRWRMDMIPAFGIMDIDHFGHYFLRTDNSHPDEEGYALIAEALLPVVLELERQGH